jgi:hypothetical protein
MLPQRLGDLASRRFTETPIRRFSDEGFTISDEGFTISDEGFTISDEGFTISDE